MSKENEQTIEVYEQFGANYLARNADAVKENPAAKKDNERHVAQLKGFVEELPKDAKIFEVGSAGGRDAKLLRSLGYTNVTTSDVPEFFLNILKDEGFSPIKFDLIKDEFPDQYDFIYCWAVLVHFKKNEAIAAINKMFGALNDGGKIALSVKHKEGWEEEWKDQDVGAKRFFSYWTEEELRECIEKAGFKEIEIEQYGGARACWLECSAKKI